MGERRKDLSSGIASRLSNRGDGCDDDDDERKQKTDHLDADALSEGWEIRYSRSRNGRIFYVNTITKVSTWNKPRGGSKDKTRLAFEEGAKLKAQSNCLEKKHPYVSANTQLKEKQVVPDATASAHSNKRKAEQTTSAGLPSSKVQKSSSVSTVQNEQQYHKFKFKRNKTLAENIQRPITKHSLEKQQAGESCNWDNSKTTTKEYLTSHGEHRTSQTDKTLTRTILTPNRKTYTSRSVSNCSQDVSTNFRNAGERKYTVPVNNSSICSKKTVIRSLNPVPSTLKSVISCSSDNKNQNANSCLVIPSQLVTSTQPVSTSVTSSAKRIKINQFSQCNSGSDNSEESCHRGTGHHLNQTNTGLTPRTSLACTTYSHSFSSPSSQTCGHSKNRDVPKSSTVKNSNLEAEPDSKSLNDAKSAVNSNFFKSSYHDSWLHSPDGTGHHLNKTNRGLTPQTSLASTSYSHSFSSPPSQSHGHSENRDVPKSSTVKNSKIKAEPESQCLNDAKSAVNSNFFKSSYHDSWLHSPDGTGHHLNKTNRGLTPQTSLASTSYSQSFSSPPSQSHGHSENRDVPKSSTVNNSKIEAEPDSRCLNDAKSAVNSNFFKSSYHDSWLHSPDGTNWGATAHTVTNNFVDSESGSCSNINFNNGSAGWPPSPSRTEEEQDIEDMEVDEELAILSNLQDVRTQASSILHEPKGLIETLTQAKSLDQTAAAVDSIKDVSKRQVILVVDTNVFISCLMFLKDIMDYDVPGYQGINLVMPWVVMQELDYLKMKRSSINNLSNHTSLRASKAIKFIYSHIIQKNSKLVGQTPQEAAEKTDLPLESNDDKILQCCMQFEQKYPDSLVVLLTRDVNLNNKAVIMGISAANNESLVSLLKLPTQCSTSGQTISTTDTTNTRKRTFQNNDDNYEGTKSNSGVETVLKTNTPVRETDTTLVRETPSSTPQRPVAKKANLGLSDKILPEHSPTASKGNTELRRLPQTEADKAAVMNKFQAVWKLIHDMKSQISVILDIGKCHANYSEAVELLKPLKPLLSALSNDFSRCLYLSPVILWEHEAEFAALCTRLNTFYAEAQNSCCDPSQQIEHLQLLKHFSDSSNRTVLFTGLEQLSAFITDVGTMLQACS